MRVFLCDDTLNRPNGGMRTRSPVAHASMCRHFLSRVRMQARRQVMFQPFTTLYVERFEKL